MNQDQIEAIRKVLECEDYVCILGMPGTGKTTTIAHLINHLVGLGKRVLVSSYTHNAVDNVLRKLHEIGQKSLLRIGNLERIAPDLRHYALDELGCKTVCFFIIILIIKGKGKEEGESCLCTIIFYGTNTNHYD